MEHWASGKIRRAIVGVLVGALVLTSGCSGDERSTEAFCDTFETEAVRIRDKYESRLGDVDSEADPFGTLLLVTGSLVEAQGDLIVLFDRLAEVAPEEIEPEVVAVRDAWQEQLDSAGDAIGNPLGAIGSGLISGLSTMGSVTRIEDFITTNCDLSSMTGSAQ